METTEPAKTPRKRGRPKGSLLNVEKYMLTLDVDDAEWGKYQPGGLSEMVRRLIRAERRRIEGTDKPSE